ncbi:hypothetical protein GWK36_01710 [Caldichromatium japonicum]|uniref:Uncharacterized protein n=1 Tax=Caldichromatium japonicum TaxID=2699430 RepID=A0A6G7VAN3_9GAMM|nr:hypothetical protein [Caldichromatium japonicum]QIK36926.1 hypothetical protein GWK36_01710 [Caldichromatium japonicum]
MRSLLGTALLVWAFGSLAQIPATPVLTVYRFNGPLEIPYYAADSFAASGTSAPSAGTLMQGTSLIPCLVIRDGISLTDPTGTPYVGFEVVVDPRTATLDSPERFRQAIAARQELRVPNHHCPAGTSQVISARLLYPLDKAPFFDPPRPMNPPGSSGGVSALDRIVRAFHDSEECAAVQRRLWGRRQALAGAWDAFIAKSADLGPPDLFKRARDLDYALRTALYEGHLGRGCSAYGACERNIVVLSIRNRAFGQCQPAQGCRFPGDVQGVASTPSQYNIWDEYLTQISGLTACYLRPDLADREPYARLQAMYAQSLPDAERVLYGSETELAEVFPGTPLSDLLATRHYYHAPAMGQCFPDHPRVEYISGAVARRGEDHALIANTRIAVGERLKDGYAFQLFRVHAEAERDRIELQDLYHGFAIDARKVSLGKPARCPAYGIPLGCPSLGTGRYRRVPSWLAQGRPVEIQCRIADRGKECTGSALLRPVSIGGACDTEMRPTADVP